jgi:hypothetical protein
VSGVLDADAPLDVPGADVLAYRDLDDAAVVWALPAGPRFATEDGAPEIALLLYRHGAQGPLAGGQLTAGLDLALTADERSLVAVAAGGPVEVRPPRWTATTATLHPAPRTAPSLVLEGSGSLDGTDHCLLVASFGADVAAALAATWEAGLPDATARVDVTFDAVRAAETAVETVRTVTQPYARSVARQAFSARARARRPAPVTLTLEGRPAIAPARLTGRTDVTL